MQIDIAGVLTGADIFDLFLTQNGTTVTFPQLNLRANVYVFAFFANIIVRITQKKYTNHEERSIINTLKFRDHTRIPRESPVVCTLSDNVTLMFFRQCLSAQKDGGDRE